MIPEPAARFASLVAQAPWVTDLWLSGSCAAGDYQPGRSDLDLVALTRGPLDAAQLAQVTAWHSQIDAEAPRSNLGCVWVPADALTDVERRWPTWSHGVLADRPLSLMARAELGACGIRLVGRPAQDVWPAPTPDDVRVAVRAELTGYWRYAARHPLLFTSTEFCDLALLSMARARHSLATGELTTKSVVLDDVAGGPGIREQVRARRLAGETTGRGRVRLACAAYADVVRTTRRPG